MDLTTRGPQVEWVVECAVKETRTATKKRNFHKCLYMFFFILKDVHERKTILSDEKAVDLVSAVR